MTWAVLKLLERPDLLSALRRDLATGEPPLLGHIIKETLRLFPAAPAGLRRTTRELTFEGFRIPKGQLVAFSIYATHRLPTLYADPLAFRPERWEALQPQPYSYLPFGGGSRYCIGAGLATRTLNLALKELVRFELTPAWPTPVREAGNTLHPEGGLLVRVGAPLTAL